MEESSPRLFDPEGPAGGCASGECLPEVEPPAAPPKATPTAALAPAADLTLPPAQLWRQAVEAVRKSSPRHAISLSHSRLRSLSRDQISLAFARTSAFHESTVTGSGRVKVEAALSEFFGHPVKLQIDNNVEGLEPSLAESESLARDSREKDVEQTLRNHPAVRATLKILGGELEHIQVLEPEIKS